MSSVSEVTIDELNDDDAIATLPPAKRSAGSAAKEKGCPKCGSTDDWGMMSWCPKCGYYPSLGENADAVANMEDLQLSWEDQQADPIRIPVWSIILFIGILGIIGESLYARLAVSNEEGLRMLWSLGQLGLGVFVLLCCQIIAGVFTAFRSSDFTPFDILLKPVEVWKANTYQLPKGSWMFILLGWSLMSIFGSIAIIGSIPYNAAFEDWGVRERAKPNLLQAVVSQARNAKGDGSEDLEGAINDFVGDANAEDLAAEEEKDKATAKRENADCIIIGYVKLSEIYYERIMLGAIVGGQLKYVGSIMYSDLPEAVQRELGERMIHCRSKRPVVKVHEDKATWLKPNLMCRVSYEKITETPEYYPFRKVRSARRP